MTQQNHAPPACQQCGHVILVTVTRGERVERYDRCGHPSGPHPMHEGCPWMVANTQGVTE